MGKPTIESFPHRFTAGDRLPEITGEYEDSAGNAIDITNFTITLQVDRPTTLLTVTATITDAVNGLFKFEWTADDLVEGNNQLATVKIVNVAGLPVTSEKFYLDVDAALA